MIAASLVKELKLLGRDLHGLAVLFVMPITFMLIMSLALSRDADPHQGSRIALVGAAGDKINTQLAAALAKEAMQVSTMPSEKLAEAQNGLHEKRFQLVLHNPNRLAESLADSKPLQIYVAPDTEPSWLAAVKGVLRQHYTETRINAYFDGSGITIDNKKLPPAVRQEIQKKIDEKNAEQLNAVSAFLNRPMLEEHYLSAGSGAVAKPNAVQHSVPAWLIFGMFFIMIPLSNVMALERQTNTITRLRLARASATGLIAAKLVPYFLINQLQFAGMLLLGRYLLPEIGVSALVLNGSLAPYALLAAAVSAAALGYALLISVCAKSTEHAVVLGGGGIILMAALGGIMVPAHVMPETMQQLTWVSPMAWGLKAFQALLLNRSGLHGIMPYLALLAGFAVLTLAAAVLVYRRQLRTQVRF
ncbi:Inner membrane transport permease ybhR [Kingella potus]|uniref:Inner membrane transport permease ybhR n=1 Tax=Kingella potus TaxID=265175 RepID=A0A377R5W4_9NEIS|nr:ABC transporter permease [Kingella potus]STR02945.1 Inner membrane transport permease ybhR [Kingella potus]